MENCTRETKKFLDNQRGKLSSFGEIEDILGKEGFCDLGFDVPVGGRLKAWGRSCWTEYMEICLQRLM